MKQKIYYVTGATGHIGRTIVNMLLADNQTVIAFVLPQDQHRNFDIIRENQIHFVEGDITKYEDVEAFLDYKNENVEQIVIHCAGIISIERGFNPVVYNVNVWGTKYMVDAALERHVSKFVYTSSVHALKELPKGQIIVEQDHFDPNEVDGLYAKTKSEATQYVLNACKNGLNAVVVHPAGVIGPHDELNGHFTTVLKNYLDGSLTSIVKGGYNLVDVRDVASGVIAASKLERIGQCYLLTGDYHPVREIIDIARTVTKRRRGVSVISTGFVKMMAPFALLWSRLKKQPPIFTAYSMDALKSNSNFSNALAKKELGFTNRPFSETIEDTMKDLMVRKAVEEQTKNETRKIKNRSLKRQRFKKIS